MASLNTTALMVVGGITLLVIVFDYFFGYKHDPREPPLIKPNVPYVGHILGLIQHGNDYVRQLCEKHKLPIFTIPMLTGRAYIIADADLALATQRQAKVISFAPFSEQFMKALFQPSKRQLQIITTDLVGPNSSRGMIATVARETHSVMSPGPTLDAMNQMMLDTLAPEIEKLTPDENGIDIELYEFIKDMITIVSTDAFYGPENPFKDPAVSKGFWEMERNTIGLAMPGNMLFARNAVKGRETVYRAYNKYFNKGGHDSGSAVIKVRVNGHMRYEGVVHEDNAKFEMGIGFALLANSVPTTFWSCLAAYADPELLAELRAELDAATEISVDEEGIKTRTLDISRMRDSCPLFLSLFEEVLRMRSTTILARTVLEDTEFANKYLLKKGSLVQMPAAVTHMDSNIWGSDSRSFDPRRMMNRRKARENAVAGEKVEKLHAAGYRSFGAAPWSCSGRYFATTEILVFIAVMLGRFDIYPLTKDGSEAAEWPTPQPGTSIVGSIMPPKQDIKVRLRPRAGVDARDRFKMIISEGGGSFPMPS